MRVHKSQVMVPPPLGPINDAACASPDMAGFGNSRHPNQRRLDFILGPHLGDRWGTRIYFGGRVRVCVLAAGKNGGLINGIIVRASERGQGFARAALEGLCVAADEARIPLLICPVPMEPGIEVERLRRWYASAGFVQSHALGDIMFRLPAEKDEDE